MTVQVESLRLQEGVGVRKIIRLGLGDEYVHHQPAPHQDASIKHIRHLRESNDLEMLNGRRLRLLQFLDDALLPDNRYGPKS
jgi:hypothetical protein